MFPERRVPSQRCRQSIGFNCTTTTAMTVSSGRWATSQWIGTWLATAMCRAASGPSASEASWTTGDNYVPRPGGWAPRPEYVSDFPNIPTDLSGSYADLDAEVHGVFHLDPNYAIQRGWVVGRIGSVHLEATVLAASGGLSDSRTVAVGGTYGSGVDWGLFLPTIDAGLSRGILHGTVQEAIVHIDISRPSVPGRVRVARPPIDRPGPQVNLSGSYHGPPELLAIMVGAVMEFCSKIHPLDAQDRMEPTRPPIHAKSAIARISPACPAD